MLAFNRDVVIVSLASESHFVFYSLHTCALTADWKRPYPLWTYVLHFADGSSAEIEVTNLVHAAEWQWPQELPGASVGWRGESVKVQPVGLYVAPFRNPHPEKTVVSLDAIASDMEGISGIVALTLGSRNEP